MLSIAVPLVAWLALQPELSAASASAAAMMLRMLGRANDGCCGTKTSMTTAEAPQTSRGASDNGHASFDWLSVPKLLRKVCCRHVSAAAACRRRRQHTFFVRVFLKNSIVLEKTC